MSIGDVPMDIKRKNLARIDSYAISPPAWKIPGRLGGAAATLRRECDGRRHRSGLFCSASASSITWRSHPVTHAALERRIDCERARASCRRWEVALPLTPASGTCPTEPSGWPSKHMQAH